MGCAQSKRLVLEPDTGLVVATTSGANAEPPTHKRSVVRRDSPTSPLEALDNCYKPDTETDRLQALVDCKCLDTNDERRFDSITSLLKEMFQVPMALVSLIDGEQLVFKSVAGTDCRQGNRLHSFCDASLRAPNPTMMVVPDTLQDARFQGSQFVKGAPYVRFYSGAPLVSSEGHVLGSLGIMDIKPRSFPAGALNMICNFAELVVRELERDKARERAANSKVETALSARGHMVRALSCFQEAVMLCNVAEKGWPILYVNENWCSDTGFSEPACLHSAFWDLFHTPLSSSGSSDERAKEEAVRAAQEQAPFTITVEGGNCSRVILDLKPATADHLSTAVPTIGIPNFVEGLAPSELKVLDGYFFAVVRQTQEQRQQGAGLSGPSEVSAPSSGSGNMSDRRAVQQRISLDTSKTGRARNSGAGSSGAGSGARIPYLHSDVQSAISYTTRPFGLEPPETLEGLKMGPLLGKGAFGRVYRGTWKSASVAVKIMEAWVDPQSAEVTQPMLEALLSKKLTHPNVVQTFDYAFHIFEPDAAPETVDSPGQAGTVPDGCKRQQQVWIVQQYCNHGTLGDAVDRGWLRTQRTLEGPPCMHAILPTAQEIASALQYLHSQDVIHGDLATGNVLLAGARHTRRSDPRSFQAKLGDFGLSRLVDSETGLRTGKYGTVSHMPLELVERGLLTKATDVFSFGVLCCEMLSGRRAWAGRSPVQIIAARTSQGLRLEVPAGCPPPFKSLVESCLMEDHTHRPTFDAIVGELEQMMAEAEAGAGPASPASA